METIDITATSESAESSNNDRKNKRGFFNWLFNLPSTVISNITNTWRRYKLLIVSVFLLSLLSAAFLWKDIVVIIGPGENGVQWRLLGGTDTKTVYGEGLSLVLPWNSITIYNSRIQQVSDEFTVLSQDGLTIKLSVSTRYRPFVDQLGLLHKNIGPEYVEKIIKPEIEAQLRLVIGQYKPEEIYTSQGFILQAAKQGALGKLSERYILLDDLLIKSIILPKEVESSIESKLKAQQLSQEMDYRLLTETKEADRKKIEAKGIEDFQSTINGGISQAYINLKGIEASLELAKSPNTKVVIFGSRDQSLPLISSSLLSDFNPAETDKQTAPKSKNKK